MKLLKRLWREEEGQGLIEYVLIIAIISLIIILFGKDIADAIQRLFTKVKNALDTAPAVTPTPTP